MGVYREIAHATHYLEDCFTAMGGPCSLRLYGDSEGHACQVAELAQQEVRRLEQKYSRYREDSVISTINRVADKGLATLVDAETAGILNYAQTLWQESDGLFDSTSGVFREVWDFRSGNLPNTQELKTVTRRVGWDKVSWDGELIRFREKQMQLDFGGIVKEMAADTVANICLNHGIGYGLIELAGDIRAIGPHPDGSPWAIGIRHPRKAGQAIATIPLYRGGLASSGDYERYMEVDGRRYCHIINPKTGWPVQHFASVSVIADQCVLAGSAATVAMLKQQLGEAWLQDLGLPYLCIDQCGNIKGQIVSEETACSAAAEQ